MELERFTRKKIIKINLNEIVRKANAEEKYKTKKRKIMIHNNNNNNYYDNNYYNNSNNHINNDINNDNDNNNSNNNNHNNNNKIRQSKMNNDTEVHILNSIPIACT